MWCHDPKTGLLQRSDLGDANWEVSDKEYFSLGSACVRNTKFPNTSRTFRGSLRGIATRSPWPSDSVSHSTYQHKTVIATHTQTGTKHNIKIYGADSNRLIITQAYSSYNLTSALITIPKEKANKSLTK